jgi:hypothetical protein
VTVVLTAEELKKLGDEVIAAIGSFGQSTAQMSLALSRARESLEALQPIDFDWHGGGLRYDDSNPAISEVIGARLIGSIFTFEPGVMTGLVLRHWKGYSDVNRTVRRFGLDVRKPFLREMKIGRLAAIERIPVLGDNVPQAGFRRLSDKQREGLVKMVEGEGIYADQAARNFMETFWGDFDKDTVAFFVDPDKEVEVSSFGMVTNMRGIRLVRLPLVRLMGIVRDRRSKWSYIPSPVDDWRGLP